MKNRILFGMIAITVILSVSITIAIHTGSTGKLPAVGIVEKLMFTNLVKQYLHPSINGWGIGLNTQQDSYLAAKFHAVTVKTLSRNQIMQILANAKTANITDWSQVRDQIRAAYETNGTTIVKGRIQINKEQYILTGIVKTETTFNGTIRSMPSYSACIIANTSAEDCENQSTILGDLSLTRKTAEFEAGKDRVWAGTMNFNNTAYTFVALVNPRLSD